jgi:Cytochrome P450
MGEHDITLMEYTHNEAYNDLRFPVSLSQGGHTWQSRCCILRTVTAGSSSKRRSEKSPDEIATAPFILGHFMRDPHVSDGKRSANVTILMIAGHDTSSHTLQLILLAIMRRLVVLARLTSD